MTKQDIQKNPINFLYVFSNEKFEALVAKYISRKAAKTIAAKRLNQIAYLQIAYNGKANLQQAYTDLAGWIQSQYALTPQQILTKLLAGETVAGKNWKEGMFGIGQTKSSTYADNSALKVDKKTGKIFGADGQELAGTSAAIYGNKDDVTQVTGYYYATPDGKAYTTKQSADGKFYAYTYGTSDGMYAADGNSVDAADFASVWDNIATAIPFIEQLLQWIASLVSDFVPLSAKNTTPAQTEFISDNSTDGIELSSVAILGAVALGGFLLMGAPKTSKK